MNDAAIMRWDKAVRIKDLTSQVRAAGMTCNCGRPEFSISTADRVCACVCVAQMSVKAFGSCGRMTEQLVRLEMFCGRKSWMRNLQWQRGDAWWAANIGATISVALWRGCFNCTCHGCNRLITVTAGGAVEVPLKSPQCAVVQHGAVYRALPQRCESSEGPIIQPFRTAPGADSR